MKWLSDCTDKELLILGGCAGACMAIAFLLLFAVGLSIHFSKRKKILPSVALFFFLGILSSCNKKGTDCRLCRTTYEYNSMIYPSFRTWTDSAIICDINFQDYERANTYFKMDSSKIVWESLKATTTCQQ